MSPDDDAKVPAAHQRPDALPEDDVEDGVPRDGRDLEEMVARRDLEPEGEHPVPAMWAQGV